MQRILEENNLFEYSKDEETVEYFEKWTVIQSTMKKMLINQYIKHQTHYPIKAKINSIPKSDNKKCMKIDQNKDKKITQKEQCSQKEKIAQTDNFLEEDFINQNSEIQHLEQYLIQIKDQQDQHMHKNQQKSNKKASQQCLVDKKQNPIKLKSSQFQCWNNRLECELLSEVRENVDQIQRQQQYKKLKNQQPFIGDRLQLSLSVIEKSKQNFDIQMKNENKFRQFKSRKRISSDIIRSYLLKTETKNIRQIQNFCENDKYQRKLDLVSSQIKSLQTKDTKNELKRLLVINPISSESPELEPLYKCKTNDPPKYQKIKLSTLKSDNFNPSCLFNQLNRRDDAELHSLNSENFNSIKFNLFKQNDNLPNRQDRMSCSTNQKSSKLSRIDMGIKLDADLNYHRKQNPLKIQRIGLPEVRSKSQSFGLNKQTHQNKGKSIDKGVKIKSKQKGDTSTGQQKVQIIRIKLGNNNNKLILIRK